VGRDTGPPRRIHYVEPRYPASAAASRARGAVQIDLTIGRDGRVADAQVTAPLAPEFDRAALAAARQWEFTPVVRDGRAVPFVYPVTVEFAPPETASPAAAASAPDPARTPPPAPVASPPASARTPPPAPGASTPAAPESPATPAAAATRSAPEIAAESSAIQELLRRYARAWESRDADAVARLHQLSPAQRAEVRATLEAAQEYAMRIDVQDISVEPTGRRATVRASIERTFNPKSRGRSQTVTTASELALEKRGDGWMVTGLR
jgi:TonB family protein